MTIGLIRQVHLNEHKRSALEWIGQDNMKETIDRMLKEGNFDPASSVFNFIKIMFDKNSGQKIAWPNGSPNGCCLHYCQGGGGYPPDFFAHEENHFLLEKRDRICSVEEEHQLECFLNNSQKYICPRVNNNCSNGGGSCNQSIVK
jgi:hypothetical protein